MDLVLLILACALVGFCVWLITTQIPMPPLWATIIQVLAAILLLLFVLRRLGVVLPNLL